MRIVHRLVNIHLLFVRHQKLRNVQIETRKFLVLTSNMLVIIEDNTCTLVTRLQPYDGRKGEQKIIYLWIMRKETTFDKSLKP